MKSWKRVALAVSIASVLAGLSGFAAADRQPSKGRLPKDAAPDGWLRTDIVPDYIVALDQDGKAAGYVKRADILNEDSPEGGDIVEVFDDTLSVVVGHMIAGRGFVAKGQRYEHVPLENVQEAKLAE